MRKEMVIIISFLVLINAGIVCGSDEILLKSRQFTPERGISADTRAAIGAIPGRVHVLVQLEHIPTIKQKKELESKGIKLLSYIPNKAWFASIPSDKANIIADLSNVRAIAEILPEDKIAPQIREKGVNDYSTNEKGEAKLVVLFFADVSLNDARIVIESYAGTFVGAAPIINALVIYLPKGLINELASDDSVKWINQHYEPILLNDGVRAAIGVDTVQAPPYNLAGTGVIAGEWDGGWVDTTHEDLEGRVTIGDTGSGTDEHSTHVAGTMLGDGTKSEAEGGTPLQWRGMAPNSIVISYEWWNDLEELNDEYDLAINTYGIDLSTNSWGWLWFGVYDERAEAVDNVIVGTYGKRIPISVLSTVN